MNWPSGSVISFSVRQGQTEVRDCSVECGVETNTLAIVEVTDGGDDGAGKLALAGCCRRDLALVE